MTKRIFIFFATALLLTGLMAAFALARDPGAFRCGPSAAPRAPEGVSPVVVELRATAELLAPEALPPCVAWLTPRYGKVVTVAGNVVGPVEATDILARFGAVSRQRGLPYWSASDHRIEPLILDAFALDGLKERPKRADFAADEMLLARALFFSEQDNRTSSGTIYKMTVIERSDDHIVLDLENASAISLFSLTLFSPGDLRSTYVLRRISNELWSYDSFTGVHENALVRLQGQSRDKSYINRALALFSDIAGMRGDAALPWAK